MSFNAPFEVLAAVNRLTHHHRNRPADTRQVLLGEPDREPGSFRCGRVR